MNRLWASWLIPSLLVILIFSSVACGGKDEPARVTEKFLRAAAENDLATLPETVDPDLAEDVMMRYSFRSDCRH